MTRWIVAYLVTALVFVALDSGYLFAVGARLFKETLGDVMAPSFQIAPAVVFYLVFPVGLMIFAVVPALGADRWTTALTFGALLGFFAYATYDLTNFATIRNWSATVTVVDLCWGTVLSGVSSAVGFALTRAILGPA